MEKHHVRVHIDDMVQPVTRHEIPGHVRAAGPAVFIAFALGLAGGDFIGQERTGFIFHHHVRQGKGSQFPEGFLVKGHHIEGEIAAHLLQGPVKCQPFVDIIRIEECAEIHHPGKELTSEATVSSCSCVITCESGRLSSSA